MVIFTVPVLNKLSVIYKEQHGVCVCGGGGAEINEGQTVSLSIRIRLCTWMHTNIHA